MAVDFMDGEDSSHREQRGETSFSDCWQKVSLLLQKRATKKKARNFSLRVDRWKMGMKRCFRITWARVWFLNVCTGWLRRGGSCNERGAIDGDLARGKRRSSWLMKRKRDDDPALTNFANFREYHAEIDIRLTSNSRKSSIPWVENTISRISMIGA